MRLCLPADRVPKTDQFIYSPTQKTTEKGVGGITPAPKLKMAAKFCCPKSKRTSPMYVSPWFYKQRNLIERIFDLFKYYRRIAT